MKGYCEKYRQYLQGSHIACPHPKEYCKFRSACIVHFMGKKAEEEKRVKTAGYGKEGVRGTNQEKKQKMKELAFEKGGGLLPAIVQDYESGQVLMLAYVNRQAWEKTLATGKAHYWSRSRNKIWLKGESSGHVQLIREIYVDCDLDTVIYKVEQLGGAACHEGFRSCFFRKLVNDEWKTVEERVFDPKEVYK